MPAYTVQNETIRTSDSKNSINCVLLVGVHTERDRDFAYHMQELSNLCLACGYTIVGETVQSLPKPNPATYIGAGKLEEVKELCEERSAGCLIFDDALSPSQVRNLNEAVRLPILDRIGLILSIFASRAHTREAMTQVQLAQYQYLLPRLSGMGEAMSRQGGTSGSLSNRGAGEKKLELNRRRIKSKINELSQSQKEIQMQRQMQRKSRLRSSVPQVCLIGYTNAGKSTLLNRLLLTYGSRDAADGQPKTVLEKDMLFTTLDTTVRRLTPSGRPPICLTDTVGFLDRLPHHLIDAFRSTLEEAAYADLLLLVTDVSDPYYRKHLEVTRQTLIELGAGDIQTITVYNKADRLPQLLGKLPLEKGNSIALSAKEGIGTEDLLDLIYAQLFGQKAVLSLLIPYAQGRLYQKLSEEGEILFTRYESDGMHVTAGLFVKSDLYAALLPYRTASSSTEK